MRTIIASLFLALCCTVVYGADVTCANGVCTKAKNTVTAAGSATRNVAKKATYPIRRIFRGR
jgi:hypothetical protein